MVGAVEAKPEPWALEDARGESGLRRRLGHAEVRNYYLENAEEGLGGGGRSGLRRRL